MCGGSEPDDPEPTAAEIISGRVARDESRRHQEYILPLEHEEIMRMRDPALRRAEHSIASGRAITQARQAEAGAKLQTRQTAVKTGVGLNSGANAMARFQAEQGGLRAATGGANEAYDAVKTINLNERLGALESGADIQRSMTTGLGNLVNMETQRSISDLQNKMTVQEARDRAISQVATTAALAGYGSYREAANPDSTHMSPMATGWRKLGVGAPDQSVSTGANMGLSTIPRYPVQQKHGGGFKSFLDS